MLDTTKHKNILLRILKDIYSDTKLSSSLGFKGGTAAFLFYDLERFSVDIDLDLLDADKKDYVFKKIKEIAQKYGKLKEAEEKRYTLFYKISYEDDLMNIKIEINLRDFGSEYEIKQYLGIPMKVMVKKDMFAHKLVAMYQRMGQANRDIYDVWFFLKNDWPINKEIVEDRVSMSFKDFINECIDSLEEMPNRGILNGIGELLDESQKDWARDNLKDEVIFNLKLLLENN